MFARMYGTVVRVESDMVELASAIQADVARGQLVYRDHTGLNVYLEIYKNAAEAGMSRPSRRRIRLERVIGTAV